MLKTYNANDLMDRQFVPGMEVIPNLLGPGVFLLAGPPKIGKSFMALDMAYCVATGSNFLQYTTTQAEVLYMALEDNDRRIQTRLYRMYGADWDGGKLLFTHDADKSTIVDDLRDYAQEHPDVRLIVVDTLAMARTVDGKVPYNYHMDYDTIALFRGVAEMYDVAIVLVHHTRKNTDGADPQVWISGTVGLTGAADGFMVLYRDSNTLQYTLMVRGRDIADTRYTLRFNPDNCRWELLSSDADSYEQEPPPLLKSVAQLVGTGTWRGTATELYEQLEQLGITMEETNAQVLVRSLNVLSKMLRQKYHIAYSNSRRAEKRTITLSWCGEETDIK